MNKSHIKKGFVRIGIYCDSDMSYREGKWEKFKDNYDGDRTLFSKAAWSKEGYEDYFDKLMAGGEGLEIELIDELEDLIEETENIIEEIMNLSNTSTKNSKRVLNEN